MGPSPAVSIVIVNYRSYDELIGCLTAALSERNSVAVETVVIDQQSDARAELIRERLPSASVISNSYNFGFAAGINQGARHTSGRYLLLLNPDTVIEPDLLRVLSEWLESHPDVAVVGPRIFNANGTVQPSARRFPDFTTGLGGRMSWLTRFAPNNWFSRRNLQWSSASEPVEVDWVSGACMMVRRSAFERVGGMDERFFLYWEDADLCRRLRNAGFRTMYVPSVSAVHEGSRASRHAAARSLIAFHRSAFRYYWKHSGLLGRLCAPFVQAVLWSRLIVKLALLKR